MRRLLPNQPPTPGRGPRPPRPAPPASFDEDELTISLRAHDEHFLERTLRCEGDDLDRAVRLYHHSGVVRQVLPDLAAAFRGRDRAAIPLREGDATPHVIVTREGHFVTCLGERMGIGGLPVIPYGRFADAMDQADSAIERSRVRRQQLRELPWEALLVALTAGPGHVTREMIRVVDRAPETYDFVVTRRYIWELDYLKTHWLQTGRANQASRRVEIEARKATDRVRLCTYLMGAMHDPSILRLLLPFLPLGTDLAMSLAAAIARHPDGADRILDVLEARKAEPKIEQQIAGALLGHGFRFPATARRVALRFRALPLRHNGWEIIRGTFESFLSVPEEQLLERLSVAQTLDVPPEPPEAPFWLFSDLELMNAGPWPWPPSVFFPPAAQAEAVKAAWDERVRQTRAWDGWEAKVTPRVHTGPRVGRNDPCPCGSGRKHKQCCLGKPPAGPSPAEQEEAAAIAEREALLLRYMVAAAQGAVAADAASGASTGP